MSTTFEPPVPIIEKNVDAIIQAQSSIILPHFTAIDAWEIGSSIRTRLLNHPKAVLISIILANQQPLFLATNHSGTSPDNSIWVSRKQKTVLRWGVPSFQMGAKFKGDEAAFAAKNALTGERAGEYAIHGGAVPVFVEGVEGVVAVVTVSGLAQEEDHGVVVEALRKFKESSSPKK
ncbi:duf336 domain-containing protein [Venturia nashicola]|uniref:Duf336 domain-containing protein n=1 Tax=Venturia nashicola TaxID=86259 RepID=A0A4Z1NN22_9PEZI|nr:duf336 domain-containing protein [Venturia nashicola]TLD22505.1 duf336 domain-containing protein [Venturia nashicola]